MKRVVAILSACLLVTACVALVPGAENVRVYKMNRSADFLRRQDQINSQCTTLKSQFVAEDGPITIGNFKNYAVTIGANVVIVGWVQVRGMPRSTYAGHFYKCEAKDLESLDQNK